MSLCGLSDPVLLFDERSEYYAPKEPAMNNNKIFDVTEHHCYGCPDLSYDITKPLVKGYCLWAGKDIEIQLRDGTFMHHRLDECYGEHPKG